MTAPVAASPDNIIAAGQSLGKRIAMLRRQSGMTQEDFAVALGVSRSTVAFWETDRNTPPSHELIQIAAQLDVPVEVFLNGMVSLDLQQTVTIDEAMLLSLYRACPLVDRIALLRAADRLNRAESTEGPGGGKHAIRIRSKKPEK
jgi:transcriptional regulator with XRE-family HTH domain